jgi:hypothetical protein
VCVCVCVCVCGVDREVPASLMPEVVRREQRVDPVPSCPAAALELRAPAPRAASTMSRDVIQDACGFGAALARPQLALSWWRVWP